MNKKRLLKQVVSALEQLYDNAVSAANRAYQSATDKENVAENKYDTLGLEAAYLAEGQSRRVAECEAALRSFQRLLASSEDETLPADEIGVGTLVVLRDHGEGVKYLLIGQLAGGLKVDLRDQSGSNEVMVITPSSPLGRALMGLGVDDQVDISSAGEKRCYIVTACY